MKRNLIFCFTFFVVLFFHFENVYAVDANKERFEINLIEAYSFEDKTETCSCSISIPELHGLKDADEERNLNEELRNFAEDVQKYYEDTVEEFKENFDEKNQPHFATGLSYEKLYENDERLVFKVNYYYSVASTSGSNTFYNIDKQNGTQIPMSDYLPDPEDMDALEAYLRAEMEAANKENPDNMYWAEGDSLEISLSNLEENRHWYVDEDGSFVVWFDKYEVAPGASGSSAFTIPDDLVK